MTKLGVDFFSLNGIPDDVDKMAEKYPYGWYQLSNGLTVNPIGRLAWLTYRKHYGGYHFWQPYPGGNWLYQDWKLYARECAELFLERMGGNYGGYSPLVDVETTVPQSYITAKSLTLSQGLDLQLDMLLDFLDVVQRRTQMTPEIYSGYYIMTGLEANRRPELANYPLCLAVYPYDNYTDNFEYMTAIQGIMDGTRKLPKLFIPAPWTKAKHVQFTGRAPSYLIPGYTKESNWATTVDLSIEIEDTTTPTPTPTYPQYIAVWNCNVRKTPQGSGDWEGILWSNSLIYVDESKIQNHYAYFEPTIQFPNGGYVYLDGIKKV